MFRPCTLLFRSRPAVLSGMGHLPLTWVSETSGAQSWTETITATSSLQQPVVSGELSLSSQMFLAFIKCWKMKRFCISHHLLSGLLFLHWLKATHEFGIGSSWTSGSAWEDQENEKIICVTLYCHWRLDGLETARAGGLCLYCFLIRHTSCRLGVSQHTCTHVFASAIASPLPRLSPTLSPTWKYHQRAFKVVTTEWRGMPMVVHFHPHQEQSSPS